MRVDFARLSGSGRTAAAVLLAMVVAVGWAAPSNGQNLIQRLFGGGGAKPPDTDVLTINPEELNAPLYCPEIRLAVGSEALAQFAPNHDGEQNFVRNLGSVTKTARECHFGADPLAMSIKVGMAGRVVAGPAGGAGKVTLPFRVAVLKQHGGKVLFDKKYSLVVTLTGPTLSTDFSEVIDPIAFKRTADDEDLIVYVGFDVPTRVGPGG